MTVITQAFSDAFQLLASGDEETFAAVQATLSTSGLAMLGCIIPGVPLGFLLGYTRFPGRNMLRIQRSRCSSLPISRSLNSRCSSQFRHRSRQRRSLCIQHRNRHNRLSSLQNP